MFLINFLHFYQPQNQQVDILDRIVHESYLPLVQGLATRPKTRLVVNISGVLLTLLKSRGYNEILNGLQRLVKSGQIELTGSSMHHAFLPLLPESELKRQILLQEDTLKTFFGKGFKKDGFFPPEMAVNDRVLKVVSELDYRWIAAPQIAYGPTLPASDKFYVDDKTGLYVFFRKKRVSSLMLSAVTRSANDLFKETQDLHDQDKYWFTVMDAETFGHHRIGHEKFLFEILDDTRFDCVTTADLLKQKLPIEKVSLRPSTWTNEEQDFWLDKEKKKATKARSFILWKDPSNPIHKLQWEFVDFVIDSVCNSPDSAVRDKLDAALASDQFWWASAKPWWSLEMIEQGACMLKDVIYSGQFSQSVNKKAEEYYRKILDLAFEWQRTGYVRKKHLENSATFMKKPFNERTPPEWYNQLVLEFEDEMRKAAANCDFEKAVKWRDALIKLKQGTDVYDVLHVVDELWSARSIPSVKPFLEHAWGEFSDFAKGDFRSKGGEIGDLTRKEFEDWKASVS